MTDGRVMNRWLVVLGAILIQLCLGAIYAWSVFTPALTAETPADVAELYDATAFGLSADQAARLRGELSVLKDQIKMLKDEFAKNMSDDAEPGEIARMEADVRRQEAELIAEMEQTADKYGVRERIASLQYRFTKTETQWIFGLGLASFAIVMIIAGRIQAKFPPRNVAIAGGVVLGLGYVAASFMGTSFAGHLICIGLIGGSGIGLAYVVPIAVGVKWFPDKKGMLTGLAVAGFGFGALFWIQLAGPAGQLIARLGVANVFLLYGIAFAAIVIFGSTWMVNPHSGWKPEGWEPAPPTPGGTASGSIDLNSSEMLRTPQFYMLWVMFMSGSMAGLMVIGCIALFGIDALRSTGVDLPTARAWAGTAMAVFFALANGLGRIGWGMISDKIGRKASLFTMFLIQGIVMLSFYQMGFHRWSLYLGSALIGFNFGGTLALFPAATADCFGNKKVGTNYGWVFTAYGFGGIVGPVLGGHFGDMAQAAATQAGGQIDPSAWATPFIVAGIACLAAAALALALRAPKT